MYIQILGKIKTFIQKLYASEFLTSFQMMLMLIVHGIGITKAQGISHRESDLGWDLEERLGLGMFTEHL